MKTMMFIARQRVHFVRWDQENQLRAKKALLNLMIVGLFSMTVAGCGRQQDEPETPSNAEQDRPPKSGIVVDIDGERLSPHAEQAFSEWFNLSVGDDIAIPLVRIEPGQFEMGRNTNGAFLAALLSVGELGDWANEGPVRTVTINRGFFIGKYKVTCEQFCAFLNSTENAENYVNINEYSSIEKRNGKFHPKEGKSTYPINVVHWDGAAQFCRWLSEASVRTVRLPTEAEWEYVARGTEGRKCPWENDDISSWTSSSAAAVDAFPENTTPEGVVGMVDVIVGEWCSDFYGVRYMPNDTIDPQGPSKDQLPVESDLIWLATVTGEYHVQRGRVTSSRWSTTSRNPGNRVDRAGIYGFRIIVELDGKEDSNDSVD